MFKTNGPGMIFPVTLRQVGFVRYLEQHSARDPQRGPSEERREEEPARLGQDVCASFWVIEHCRPDSLIYYVAEYIHDNVFLHGVLVEGL